MNHLSLFSGAGMTDLAAERVGFKTVAFAETEKWLHDLLRVRYPGVGNFGDVRNVPAKAYLPLIDLISGGFPCQDISPAGYKAGLTGARSGLWTEFLRIICAYMPRYVLVENVALLRKRGLSTIINDLHHAGYDCWWDCIPAAAVGAPHIRDRLWIQCVRRDSKRYPLQGTKIGEVESAGFGVAVPGDVSHFSKGIVDLPRAGQMADGNVSELIPVAPQGQCRQYLRSGKALLKYRVLNLAGGRNNLDVYGRYLPPAATSPVLNHAELWPTPTRSDSTGGPGATPKRTGGRNLRTVVDQEDLFNGAAKASLNPTWVEWLMGLPLRYTNPDVSNDDLLEFQGWHQDDLERTIKKANHRRPRLAALGNGLVPQVAEYVLRDLLDKTGNP